MNDEYLWDRRGPPDQEIQRLEQLLGRLRVMPAEPAWPAPAPRPGRASLAYLATAAALVLACAAGLFTLRWTTGAWAVAAVAGTPMVGSTPVRDDGRLAVGEWLETDARSRATLEVADIGRLELEPETRMRLVSTRSGHHRLALSGGTVHATIWAPPGQFVIDTPSSRAIDLGCVYTLRVDRDTGAGLIEVTVGWVAFEHQGRESFIPAGAQCATRPGVGPGTPRYDDAPRMLTAALDELDFGAPNPDVRRAAIDQVLASARPRDAFSVWHLLSRASGEDRDRLFDGLSRLMRPPPGVTRERVRNADRAALDAWWDALGLGSMADWGDWKSQWRDNSVFR